MSEDERTIYVGNISDRVSEEILYELFLQAGPLEKVTIPKDKEGRRRKFGFVTYKHDVSVPYTLQLLNGVELYGWPLQLKSRNTGKDANSPGSSPRMSPTVFPPGGASPRHNTSGGYPGQGGQFHRSHTWHGDLSAEGRGGVGGGHYQRQNSGSSPSPNAFRQGGQQDWSSRGGGGYRSPQSPQPPTYSQRDQGWFNQASPMLPPPPNHGQSNDLRRQRLREQQQIVLDSHRQRQPQRHQNLDRPPHQHWQNQRYGRY